MQQPGVAERLGVAAEQLPESAWWLDSSGAVFAGAKAVNAAVSTALGTELPMRVYRLPGVGRVEETVYQWVAAHRYKFPGATPLCESEPEQCVSPEPS